MARPLTAYGLNPQHPAMRILGVLLLKHRNASSGWRPKSTCVAMAASLLAIGDVSAADPVPKPAQSTASPSLDRWPRFRGPAGSGIGSGSFPIHFGPESNVVWSVAMASGHSSPCIWDGHIFLTGFDQGKLITLAIDRETGQTRWRRELAPGFIERGAQHGSPATATPTTDGERVVCYFGAFGVISYDFSGNELWRHPLPIPVTQHGAGTSPVIAGDLVLLNCDQDTDSQLLALDRRNGKTVWKADRPGFRRGFSTPLPWPETNPEQIIVPGTLRMVSYNLSDGSERWSVRGFPNEMVSSPVSDGKFIYAAGWTYGSGVSRMPAFEKLIDQSDSDRDGRLSKSEAPAGPAKQHFAYIDADKDGFLSPQEYKTIAKIFDESRNLAISIDPTGRGDVTDSHVRWTARRGLPYVPSPLLYDNKLFLVKNGGLFSCLNAKTGEFHFQEERIGALGDYYASPVAANGVLCVISQQGVATLIKATERLEVISQSNLREPVLATPGIAGHSIYIRTASHLFRFGPEHDSAASRSPKPVR